MQARIFQKPCIAILSLLALALAGCGGGGGGGGETELASISINAPPTVSIIQPSSNPSPLNVNSDPSLDIIVKATDPDGGKLNCTWTYSAGSMSPKESTINAGSQFTSRFTPPNYDGSCTLKITVSDGEASASANMVVQVTGNVVDPGDPDPPLRIISINASPDTVKPSAVSNVSATVDNPGGKPLTYAWTCNTGKLTGTGSTVSWTAPKTSGEYGIYLTVSNGSKSASASRTITVSNDTTSGLLGQYYTTYRDREVVTLNDMVFSRIDPSVNFNWAKLSPAPGKVPADGFGVKWTGYVKCEAPGEYVFRVHVDDGARMKVQDDTGKWVAVIPNNNTNWNDHAEGAWLPSTTIPLTLQGGKWYPIELEYFEGGGDAFIHLYWSINGGTEVIIPQAYLRPPS